jgi:hypothetical protein
MRAAIAALLLMSPTLALAADPPEAPVPAAKTKRPAATAHASERDDPPHASPWWLRKDLADGALDPMWGSLDGAIGGIRLHGLDQPPTAKATGITTSKEIHTVGQEIVRDDLDGYRKSIATHARNTAVRLDRVLPPDVIRRVIEDNYGRFRFCYRAGLRANSSLEGRVVVRFEIEPTGNVVVAADRGSDLPDADVVSCIVRGFATLSFPGFQGGPVTVVYPLVFTPPQAR